MEKDGTFVNCDGRVQRIGQAFPPRDGSREDWQLLLSLSELLGRPLEWRGPEQIFSALAQSQDSFAGLSYASIGAQGAQLTTSSVGAGVD